MKFKIYLLGIILVSAGISITACRRAGSWLVKEDKPLHSDAIVVLMGSNRDRVLQARDLYKQGLAGKVIMVEPTLGGFEELKAKGLYIISGAEQALNAFVDLGIPHDSIIILPGNANSTKMEAVIIRKYLANNQRIDTLLLVSSAPHTRRASMIFKSAFRKAGMQVVIVCSPSNYTNFNSAKWWMSKRGIQIVLSEYVKMTSFVLVDRNKLGVN